MVVIELTSQLGNQMFCYASAKAIALKHNYVFKCYQKALNAKTINDSDKKYGSGLPQIFNIPNTELLNEEELKNIENFSVVEEPIFQKLKGSVYQKSIANCSDNTKIKGYLISTRYFFDVLEQVRSWFVFPKDIQAQAEEEFNRIKKIAGTRKICAVHFRVGKDYFQQGYKISEKYQFLAANRALSFFENRGGVLFVVFFDREMREVRNFKKRYLAVDSHNSMIVDMCVVSKCDAAIVSNSTFAIWSALLSKNPKFKVWRPSKYPIIMGYTPNDCFLESWESVPARRAYDSSIYMYLRNIASKIKHFFDK